MVMEELKPFTRARDLRSYRMEGQLLEVLENVGISDDLWRKLRRQHYQVLKELEIDEEKFNMVLEYMYILRAKDEYLDQF